MNYMKENSIVSKQMAKQWEPAMYDVNEEQQQSETKVEKVEESNFGPKEYGIFGATFFVLFASVFGVYMLQPDFDALRFQRLDSIGGTFLVGLGIFLATIAISFLIF
ncbi:hypothetical protein KUH03_18250 [Sphingobacterium sp. E70]|nr:hypothetical protein [Sphingobacterium sp. E70]ULT28345.1 hypothetical protein KUH03_18250 [Sphingobacterium sp. E70]